MTELRRVYDPAECDEHGVPLDWERCRCQREVPGGMGSLADALHQRDEVCPDCGGHGSLKAAVLAERLRPLGRRIEIGMSVLAPSPDPAATGSKPGEVLEWKVRKFCFGYGDDSLGGDSRDRVVLARGTDEWSVVPDELPPLEARCEGCGHPMSDGTIEKMTARPLGDEERRLVERSGLSEPWTIHWSPCDEGCRHGGPRRQERRTGGWNPKPNDDAIRVALRGGRAVEASWRAVEVRVGMVAKRAGMDPSAGPLVARPFDLRSENVALLCTRCWAA